jgi:hypothetical protein
MRGSRRIQISMQRFHNRRALPARLARLRSLKLDLDGYSIRPGVGAFLRTGRQKRIASRADLHDDPHGRSYNSALYSSVVSTATN